MQLKDTVFKPTISTAMLISSYFFIKKDYLEYDRYLICTAALFMASKLNNEHKGIEFFVLSYFKLLNKIKGNDTNPPLQNDEKNELITKIINSEMIIFKVMFENEGNIFGVELASYRYVNDYIKSLFHESKRKLVADYANTYLNDTFFTTIPLIYGEKEIALS